MSDNGQGQAYRLPSSFAELTSPELSDHAILQWDNRTPPGSVAPERAVAQAISVPACVRPLFQTGHHPVPDDVQLYLGRADGEVFGVCFVINELPEPVVRTVYRIESKHDAATRAFCWAYLMEES